MGLLLAVAAIATGSARADLWYQHYQKAQEALEKEQWSEAIEELNQAIERRGDSGARVRTYGMRTTDYFPYLKLGVAYFQLAQLEAATQAFETEERLGAIQASEGSFDELERFRELVDKARNEQLAEESRRIRQILTESLQEARLLQNDGRLEEAMVALGRGLAVSPEDSEANALMASLRDEAQRRQSERETGEQVSALLAKGRALLAEGSFGEASSRFRQALALQPGNSELGVLLEESQRLLRQELATQQKERDREWLVSQTLALAEELEAEGRHDEALDRLQEVVAMAPDNSRARALEERLIDARTQASQESARLASMVSEIETAEEHFASGRFETALSAANRALAFDPENDKALAIVARAYRQINRVLLGRGLGGNIPPAIRFADFRREQEDGSSVQLVHEAQFRLSGVIIDNSPVQIVFTTGTGRNLEGVTARQQLGDFYLTEFYVDTDLDVGPVLFRLVATDDDELISSSEYSVIYVRPWYRSPWLYSGVFVIFGLVVAGGLMQRSRRRLRRRRRRFNPYVAGAPVLDEGLFFGRDKLIDRILQTIHNNSLLLYGERRIGKTSIQHHLRKRLQELEDPNYDFFPVYVDLQGTPENRFFATIADDVFQALAARLEGLEAVVFAKPHEQYTYRDLVGDLRRVLKRLQEQSSKRVKLVLLIDEVDELNDYDPRINQRLRSLFMKSFAESLVAVVSGVEIKRHWEKVGSPWYNFFEEIEVQPLQEQEARDLVQKPIAGVLKLDDEVIDRIIELTDRRPYLIQKMCISLVNEAYEKRQKTISLADVEAFGRPEAV